MGQSVPALVLLVDWLLDTFTVYYKEGLARFSESAQKVPCSCVFLKQGPAKAPAKGCRRSLEGPVLRVFL